MKPGKGIVRKEPAGVMLARGPGPQVAKPATPRPKRCKACKTVFTPSRSMQAVCTPHCAQKLVDLQNGRVLAKAALEKRRADLADRKATREKLAALKTRGDWVKEAEKAVRDARRLEELAKGRGCMSCGRSRAQVEGTEGWKPGGSWDAGHFLGKGAHPELRMEPKNIWLQCKSCNAGSAKFARKGLTVGQAFEENLRAAEGDALVDWLKGPHPATHHAVEDLQQIKATYGAIARELKKGAK